MVLCASNMFSWLVYFTRRRTAQEGPWLAHLCRHQNETIIKFATVCQGLQIVFTAFRAVHSSNRFHCIWAVHCSQAIPCSIPSACPTFPNSEQKHLPLLQHDSFILQTSPLLPIGIPCLLGCFTCPGWRLACNSRNLLGLFVLTSHLLCRGND